MAETNNGSFIPKSSNRVKRKVRTTRRIYIFSYISYVLFFGALLAVVGVMFYSSQVSKALEEAKVNLNDQRNLFSDADIDRIKALDQRLATAEELLDSLSAPTEIFSDIEETVAESVVLTGFNYEYQPNQRFVVAVTGHSSDFNQVLYQRDVFNQSPIFRSAIVSTFSYAPVEGDKEEDTDESTTETESSNEKPNGDEVVTFEFTSENDSSLITYEPRAIELNENDIISIRPGDDYQFDDTFDEEYEDDFLEI